MRATPNDASSFQYLTLGLLQFLYFHITIATEHLDEKDATFLVISGPLRRSVTTVLLPTCIHHSESSKGVWGKHKIQTMTR